MSLRRGKDYLAVLQDGREVWLAGERVNPATQHDLAPGARTLANLYDLQHDPAHRDVLVMRSPGSGEPVSLAYLEPRSTGDLLKRRAMIEFLMRRTGAVMGRLPEYMALMMLGLYDARDFLAEVDPQFGRNVSDFFHHCRDNDLALTHGFADLPRDRARPDTVPYLRIVDRSDRGVTLRGAKAVATLAPYADEFVGFTAPRPDAKPDEVIYFAVPMNTPGLKVICRPSLHPANPADHPIAGPYDEMDAWVVFDDVHVPRERLFFLGRPDLSAALFARASAFVQYHILIRLAVKAEILTGIAASAADYLGTTNAPHTQNALYELISYTETLRAFLFAAEHQPVISPTGLAIANPAQLMLGRAYGVERLPAILQTVRELCGSSLLMSPSDADLDCPETGNLIRRFMIGGDERAPDRYRLFKLAWDYTADSFGSRQLLFEMYNANTLASAKARIVSGYDLAPMKHLAGDLARERKL